MDALQTVLVRGICWLVHLVPVRIAGAVGAGLGRLAFYLVKRRREIAIRNLTRIYPERDRRWRKCIARESFAELGRSILEIPHVFMRSRAFLKSRIQVEGEDEYLAAMARGKGVFNILCHHSNMEMCGLMYAARGSDVDIIYRALNQPLFDAFVKRGRERFGISMHSRQQGLRWLPRALKQGHSIAILLDQHLSGGMPVPFLGHLASTTTLPAVFVLKHGTPVFGMALHRIGKSFRFRLQFWRINMPATTGDKDADIYRIMHCIGKSFEPIINQRPELWLWSHQRWKLLEEHYKDITEVVYGTP